ncbi:hypothetical protein FRB98_001726 [Tulasnella sp. 332]|nr:hypothetical protein FRB98_001726 [Tulasnella sp. 332]
MTDELQTIQSIFPDDFQLEVHRAWKVASRIRVMTIRLVQCLMPPLVMRLDNRIQGAAMPPAFSLRVAPDDSNLNGHVFFTLHVQYSKTYPAIPATFTIKAPMSGLSQQGIKSLSNLIRDKAKQLSQIRQEMVFEIHLLCIDFLTKNHTYQRPEQPAESIDTLVAVSLAAEMDVRAKHAEQAMQEQADKEADGLRKQEQERADRLAHEMQLDVKRREQTMRAEQERKKARESVLSLDGDGRVDRNERFTNAISIGEGLTTFNSVRIVGSRSGTFGKVLIVEPVLDTVGENDCLPPMELQSITFESAYYQRSQGKKRLRELETELQDLVTLQHPNLSLVYAAEIKRSDQGSQTLNLLTEPATSLTLEDVLEHSDGIRRDKAVDYLVQVLSGLEALCTFRPANNHERVKFCHRTVTPACAGLIRDSTTKYGTRIKLDRAWYYGKLLDFHKSNPINDIMTTDHQAVHPRTWISQDMEDSPHVYSQRRDIWDAGILMIQMLMGFDVISRYASVWSALEALPTFEVPKPLYAIISSMFDQSKKSAITCAQLIHKLKNMPLSSPSEGQTIFIPQGPSSPTSPVAMRRGAAPADYFARPLQQATGPLQLQRSSRYRDEWEEIEFLGKGGFGSVVKARFKLDGAIYAVKKIKLRKENDGKIYREINALSKLNHRFIVRYHTTWIETICNMSGNDSPMESSESTSYHTTPARSDRELPPRKSTAMFRLDDFSLGASFSESSASVKTRTTSFPSIVFGNDDGSSSEDDAEEGGSTTEEDSHLQPHESSENGTDDEETSSEGTASNSRTPSKGTPLASRGPSRGPSASGDVKIGDFGLATPSLASIDPSDVTNRSLTQPIEMTSGVGTALYTAPEMLSRSRHPSHNKVDMYSLGIVFFEMCWPPFTTATERVHVLTKLRLPSITFPETWENKERQRVIITKLLQHNPTARPSALELSNSNLLPEQEHDAYFAEARRKIHNSEDQCETFVAELFQKRFDDVKQLSYDIDASPAEHTSLNDVVKEHLEKLFRLHGAVHKEPLLLLPITDVYDDERQPVKLLDAAGRTVSLPRDLIVAFARSAVPSKGDRSTVRVKRFHIGNTYTPSPTGKQPIPRLTAFLDIIHSDSLAGAAEGELLRILHETLSIFPGVGTHHLEICISHSDIIESVFNKVPMTRTRRRDISSVLYANKPWSQKRAQLLNAGLKNVIEEIEILSSESSDGMTLLERLEKLNGSLPHIRTAFAAVDRTIQIAQAMGVRRPIMFKPFIMLNQPYFREGIVFEVRGAKRSYEVIARGGRYDHLITKFSGSSIKSMRAVGLQISLSNFTSSLAESLSLSVPRLMKESKSFGYWSPRRCDVYVVSTSLGKLAERIELVTLLWKNGISADLQYESAIENGSSEPGSYFDTCIREGILFMVWYRPKSAQRDHSFYKVKSLLKNTEDEGLRSWSGKTHRHIAEQKRIDQATAGSASAIVSSAVPTITPAASSRDAVNTGPDVQVVMSGEVHGRKFQKHKQKMQYAEKAYAVESDIRTSVTSGLLVISVELSGKALEVLTANNTWITSDSALKSLLSDHKEDLPHAIVHTLKEVLLKKRVEEGSNETLLKKRSDDSGSGSGSGRMVGLMSIREDRVFLFKL